MKITFSTRAGEPEDIRSPWIPPTSRLPFSTGVSWQVVDEPLLLVCTLDSPVMELSLLRGLLRLLLETVVLWLLYWLLGISFPFWCLPLLASTASLSDQICTSSPGLCLKYHPSLMEIPDGPCIWRFPTKHSILNELCGPGNSASCTVVTWMGSKSKRERVYVCNNLFCCTAEINTIL